MPIVLDDVLTHTEVTALRESANTLDFEEGARTAGRIARAVKQNLQAVSGPATDAVLEKVRTALVAHPVFQAVAYPRAAVKLMLSRTESGGHYGDHVDNALMGGGRADISFTLFLSPPDTYTGGELVVTDRIEDRAFKLGAGEIIVYPSNTLHRVNPVTDGSRLAMVGWFTSWVRDPARREILFDLWRAVAQAEAAGDAAQVLLLSRSRSNLLRMWAG